MRLNVASIVRFFRVGCGGVVMGLFVGLFMQITITVLTPTSLEGCGEFCFDTKQSRVQAGDERLQIIQSLTDAWHHGVCYLSEEYATDVFLYGPRQRERVYALIVHSRRVGDHLIADRMGLIEQELLYEYKPCLPRELWDNSLEKPALYFALMGLVLMVTYRFWTYRITMWRPDSSAGAIGRALLFIGAVIVGVGLITFVMVVL